MGVLVSLDCSELDKSDLQDLTDELAGELNGVQGISAERAALVAAKGARGDVISIGTIVLTFISSGAAVAAINVLKTYFDREPTLKIKFKSDAGDELTLDAKNLKAEQVDKALKLIDTSLKKKK